ncbi:hypothetical protein O6H91_16G070900 [Diphasiastrum complanatum]|uniref:Uncharacterized protein n=1 Tax=Diphasiastrum complanatum TaxID=34168 RepID=A0ACC2BDH7_DIPCM|nr:hypothetical protein O6H91_16G070900 [Diphasiastrum complanatum]
MEKGEAYRPRTYDMPGNFPQFAPRARAQSFDGVATPTAIARSRTIDFDLIDLILRISAIVLSIMAFSITAADHLFLESPSGKGLVAANVLAFLYSLCYIIFAVTGLGLFSPPVSEWINFILDQLLAYLLLSTFGAAAGIIGAACAGNHQSYCSKGAASVSMAFFAFMAVAASAIVSGFELAKQILQL